MYPHLEDNLNELGNAIASRDFLKIECLSRILSYGLRHTYEHKAPTVVASNLIPHIKLALELAIDTLPKGSHYKSIVEDSYKCFIKKLKNHSKLTREECGSLREQLA